MKGPKLQTCAQEVPPSTRPAVSDWPEPGALATETSAVATLSEDMLPEVFRPWLVDTAERLGCPLDFLAVAAIVALSSLVGRALAIRPKRFDTWGVVANLWGLIVAAPGALKSPALEAALAPIRLIEKRARELHENAIAKWREVEQALNVEREALHLAIQDAKTLNLDTAKLRGELAALVQPSIAPLRRYVVNDYTVEKLGELLGENPRGLLLFRDELAGWLAKTNQSARQEERAFVLETWSGNAEVYTIDRIGRGTLRIPAPCLSILGGIQEGPLSHHVRRAAHGLDVGADGLLQRFQLMVFPNPVSDWHNVDRVPDAGAASCANRVFRAVAAADLAERLGAVPAIEGGIPYLHFAPEAQVLFDDWRTTLENRLRRPVGDSAAFTSHLAKYRSLLPSLALLFHIAQNVLDGVKASVGEPALRRGIEWTEYLESHARRVYAGGAEPVPSAASKLAARIENGTLKDPFSLRSIYVNNWSGLATSADARSAVDELVRLGWLAAVPKSSDPLVGGRPTTLYLVNPKCRR